MKKSLVVLLLIIISLALMAQSAHVTGPSSYPGVRSNGNGINVKGSVGTNVEYDNGTCTTAKAIAAANGNRQKVTLTNAQTCALTFTQPTSGTISIQLKIVQSTSGSFNGNISGGLWPGGTSPTITATSGAVDIVTCYLDGTNAYCIATQDFR